jgi:short-subunit dehydrogenase
LVTGASSGIGKEIARRLAAEGTELVLVARDEQRLDALAAEVDVACEVLVADLADPTELSYVEDRLRDVSVPIDLLVNNAGVGHQGLFHELDLEREAAMVDVNVVALHRLAQVAAVEMAAAGRGGILNVSSMAGFAGAPGTATYAATKAFVTSLSEAIHAELAPFGVHVTALCPGFTRTEFQDRADYDTSKLPDFVWQTAEQVAEAGLRGIAANRTVVVPGAKNKIGAGVINVLPGSVRRFALDKLPR